MNDNEARALGRWCEEHQTRFTRVHLPNGLHVTGCHICVERSELATLDPAALIEAIDKAKADRAAEMPDDAAALAVLHRAYMRLKELGWRDALYCPKDGSEFDVIEMGSTGVHTCAYFGDWPNGVWLIDGDSPSRPILFRLKS